MTPDTLRTIGAALYGAQWQSALARDLSVSDRHMRRWLAGAAPIPAGVLDECRALLSMRRVQLGELLHDLAA